MGNDFFSLTYKWLFHLNGKSPLQFNLMQISFC